MHPLISTFHWKLSQTLIQVTYTHSHPSDTLELYLAFFVSPAPTPVNLKLLCIDLSLFLPPPSPLFLVCCVFTIFIYLFDTSCFLWKQQTWQVRFSCTSCVYREIENLLSQQKQMHVINDYFFCACDAHFPWFLFDKSSSFCLVFPLPGLSLL